MADIDATARDELVDAASVWVEHTLGPVSWVKVSAGIVLGVQGQGVVKLDGGSGMQRAVLASQSPLFPSVKRVLVTPWGPAALFEHITGAAPADTGALFAAGYAAAELQQTAPPPALPPARWIGPILSEYAARGVPAPEHVAYAYAEASTMPFVWVHGNLHAGNALTLQGRCRFVDSEGTGFGPAVADLATLLSSAWFLDGRCFGGPMGNSVLSGFLAGGGDRRALDCDISALVEGALFVLNCWVKRLNAQDPANAAAWAAEAGSGSSVG